MDVWVYLGYNIIDPKYCIDYDTKFHPNLKKNINDSFVSQSLNDKTLAFLKIEHTLLLRHFS